jgi:Fe2+ transport system protein B
MGHGADAMIGWTREEFKRYFAEKEPDWEEAVIMLIDGLRAYIKISRLLAMDFLSEDQITRKQYDDEMREVESMEKLLKQLEAAELDSDLHGLIKR